MLIHIDDMRAGYQKILGHVVMRGRHVAPRGKQTLELPSTTIHLTDPTACIATGISRGFSMKFAYAEAIQLLGGFSDVPQFCDWFPQMKAFLDDGIMHGAYGPRIRAQVTNVLERLTADPESRQAVIQIWEKEKDLSGRQNLHDYPCTLSLQFLIRDGCLELHTTMRSNDVWLGTPYDIFQFCFLQLNVAELLQVDVGDYYHHANSLHAYMTDMSGIMKVQHAEIAHDVSQLQPLGVTVRAHQQWVCEQIWHGNDATLSTDGARIACKALHG